MSQIQVQEQEELSEEQKDVYNKLMSFMSEELEEIYEFMKKFRKKGLILLYAYHCHRCNFVWLPKDFDIRLVNYFKSDKGLWNIEPPKACARCKSKYWNRAPIKKTKNTYFDENIKELVHDRYNSKRMKALYRWLLKDRAEQDKRIKFLEEDLKKRGIKLDD